MRNNKTQMIIIIITFYFKTTKMSLYTKGIELCGVECYFAAIKTMLINEIL